MSTLLQIQPTTTGATWSTDRAHDVAPDLRAVPNHRTLAVVCALLCFFPLRRGRRRAAPAMSRRASPCGDLAGARRASRTVAAAVLGERDDRRCRSSLMIAIVRAGLLVRSADPGGRGRPAVGRGRVRRADTTRAASPRQGPGRRRPGQAEGRVRCSRTRPWCCVPVGAGHRAVQVAAVVQTGPLLEDVLLTAAGTGELGGVQDREGRPQQRPLVGVPRLVAVAVGPVEGRRRARRCRPWCPRRRSRSPWMRR